MHTTEKSYLDSSTEQSMRTSCHANLSALSLYDAKINKIEKV